MRPTPPDLLSDSSFPATFGRYVLRGVLGEGAMARVFDAELQGPQGFRKPAALKVVRTAIASRSEKLRAALVHEARLGGVLSHPNVVGVFDFGEVDGLPFVAMERIDGSSLDLMLQDGPFEVPHALEVMAQVCAGLHHAHEAGMVHRDLKPSNVMIDRHGTVKVLDFGIAKLPAGDGTNTDTGMTKGTPAYMSPEQVEGRSVDRRSDVFAVGILLWELLRGTMLFQRGSLVKTMTAVIEVEKILDDPAFAAQLEHYAPGLAAVVRTCLRLDPDRRYDTCDEVEVALRDVRRNHRRTTRQHRARPAPPATDWIRPTIAIMVGLCAAVAGLIAFVLVQTIEGRGPEAHAVVEEPAEPVVEPVVVAVSEPETPAEEPSTDPVEVAEVPETPPKRSPTRRTSSSPARRPGPALAPEPPPVEEPAEEPSGEATAEVVVQTEVDTTVRFAARAEDRPVLHWRKTGGRWRSAAMKRVGPQRWTFQVRFTELAGGGVSWWVEERDGGALTPRTQQDPHQLAVN